MGNNLKQEMDVGFGVAGNERSPLQDFAEKIKNLIA